MSNSTNPLNLHNLVSIADFLEDSSDFSENYPQILDEFYNWYETIDYRTKFEKEKNFQITEIEHALNRAFIRNIGRTEHNSTASPDTRVQSNQYPDHASKLEGRIKEFLSYATNWDGDNAEEIPFQAIYDSLNFLSELQKRMAGYEPRSAAPSPDGEIALYWHNPSGYAEINFDGSGNISMCWADDSDVLHFIEEEIENVDKANTSRIWENLSNFLGDPKR